MKYPDWYKQFREVEMVALEGVKPAVRAVYHYLRASSPGVNCEPVTQVNTRELSKTLLIGLTTVSQCIKELEKRKLIKTFKSARKDGIEFQFCFDYQNSTIKIIRGQVIVVDPRQDQGQSTFDPTQDHTDTRQDHTDPEQDQLPYIEGEESIYNALRKQIAQQLRDLKVFPRIFEPIIKTPLGVRFAKEILDNHPEEGGAVIRVKLEDQKNLNQFKVIDMFRREGSQTPSGTVLEDSKTGDQGEWEWCGKMGKIHLENETVIIKSLASFRRWVAA